jgi:hypothetical protein
LHGIQLFHLLALLRYRRADVHEEEGSVPREDLQSRSFLPRSSPEAVFIAE